ncbi:FAD/NAD(P)-binding protein [Mucilaginibacter myungsuensis]|uniref:FAD/NAD(P)-binding protein n=1 Tax=Mucilaginibacter myungsuensis TaxID=649104 RepID=A0A929L2J3_9SPHI|nr:FAD/NAD(P)-binding protein [Mucilaginibacter myungsuensis]MBE9662910.1 FAD/NAD(P)-binding protein [Mucilaginibacter myungsuensis]MDN3598530.1 FAD/NAD(P)-binding protein [Mucilaginibacter myungsuensis]
MPIYDLVFVGSGLSSTATITNLLTSLQNRPILAQPLRIAVIEKSGEFWTGIAYGKRTSVHSLTINPVKDFFQDADKPIFFDWLTNMRNQGWPGLTDEKRGIAETWSTGNSDKITASDLEGLYIPRFLYGVFLTQHAEKLVADCATAGIATVDLITGEAVDADKTDDGYLLSVNNAGPIIQLHTRDLVLATGSLDARLINNGLQHNYVCVDDVYGPSLKDNLDKISEGLSKLEPGKRDILIIGSNASASEVVHILAKNIKTDADGFDKIYILSTSGLPDRLHVNSDYDHLMHNLKALDESGTYDADKLIAAIQDDVNHAATQGLSVGKIHYSLGERAVKIQQKLPADEALKFFKDHGWTFTRITRRTSENYYFTEKELADAGRLEFINGRFVRFAAEQDDPNGLTFIYTECKQGDPKPYQGAFAVVVNCSGAEHITETTSKLIRNMLDKSIVRINDTNMGVSVNEHFAANDHLYIIGPLMAGIYNSKFKFWHLENAKRLNSLAPMLAKTLLAER